MEHSREVSLLCPGQRRLARWRAFAWKRCCRWDRRIFYPCDYRRAFACSLIPDPPPHKRFSRTRVPPQWCVGKEDCGPYFVPLHDPRGKVVPLGRWCNIRGRGTLKPLRLTTYLFGSSLSAALARRTSRPLTALQLVFTLVPVFLAPDRLVLLAVAVSAHALTAGLVAEATLFHGLQTPLPAVVENS
jgi:hypothetical protein